MSFYNALIMICSICMACITMTFRNMVIIKCLMSVDIYIYIYIYILYVGESTLY